MADVRRRIERLERQLNQAESKRCPRCGGPVFTRPVDLWVATVYRVHGLNPPGDFCRCSEPAATPDVQQWLEQVVETWACRQQRDSLARASREERLPKGNRR